MRARLTTAVALAAAALSVALVAVPANASTIRGRIAGVTIPASGSGEAGVRAVNLGTGVVAADAVADAAGRYRLTVPQGAFGVFPYVVRIGRLVRPPGTVVRLRSGRRATVVLRPKALLAPTRPIVGVKEFTGGTGELSVLNRGIADMLITDLAGARLPGCEIRVVEVSERRLAFRRAELELVRRGLVDPATAIRAGLLIRPTRGVRGRISEAGGQVTLSAEIFNWRTGRTLKRTSVSGATQDFFALEPALAAKLVALLCEKPPPIDGTFSGTADFSKVMPAPVSLRVHWNGTVRAVPQTSVGGIPIPQFGPTVTYVAQVATLTARVEGTTPDGCTISGIGTFDLLATHAGQPVPVMSVTEASPDTYNLFTDAGTAAVPTVTSGCPPPAQDGAAGAIPLAGVALMAFTKDHPVVTPAVFAGNATEQPTPADPLYTWSWSLRG